MFSTFSLRRGGKVEGESPFWISFSDLMSALMVLFLVVMAVTLVAVTKTVSEEEKVKIQREKDIRGLMALIRADSQSFHVKVDEAAFRIDLGDIVRFDSGNYTIKPDAARFLRAYIPILLKAKSTAAGKDWMRRVVIEGFTDQDGTYLYNLALSLNRSRSVVCSLFVAPTAGEAPLSRAQLTQIQQLFLVGGYSFNSMRADKAASRRVELKVEFWGVGEKPREESTAALSKEFGQC